MYESVVALQEDVKVKVPPKPSYNKRLRSGSGYSSGLGDKSPTKSAKLGSTSSEPISVDVIKEDSAIPEEAEIVSILSDSPEPKTATKSVMKQRAASQAKKSKTVLDFDKGKSNKIILEFDKDTSVHSGFDLIHKECSKLLFDQDRKAIFSMRTSGSGHAFSQETLKVCPL